MRATVPKGRRRVATGGAKRNPWVRSLPTWSRPEGPADGFRDRPNSHRPRTAIGFGGFAPRTGLRPGTEANGPHSGPSLVSSAKVSTIGLSPTYSEWCPNRAFGGLTATSPEPPRDVRQDRCWMASSSVGQMVTQASSRVTLRTPATNEVGATRTTSPSRRRALLTSPTRDERP